MSSTYVPVGTLEDLVGCPFDGSSEDVVDEYVFNLGPKDEVAKSDSKLGLEDVVGSVSELGLEDGLKNVIASELALETNRTFAVGKTAPKGRLDYLESMFRKCTIAALSSMNEKQAESNGMKYKLVQSVDYIPFLFDGIYHCNFIAGPENGSSEADNVLVFAEVKYHKEKLRPVLRNGKKLKRRQFVLTCTFYCILGPSDLKAPEMEQQYGCNSCDRFPGRVHHPENGGFKRTDTVDYESDSDDNDDYANVIIPKERVPYRWVWGYKLSA